MSDLVASEPARPEAEEVAKTVILPFLQEYTALLRTRCDEHAQMLEQRLKWLTSMMAACLFCIGVMLWLALQFKHNTWSDTAFGVGAAAICILILFVFFLYDPRRLRGDVISHEIVIAATWLHRIVRLASQMEDHAVANFGLRLALDMRLAEAEAMLHLAALILKRESNSFDAEALAQEQSSSRARAKRTASKERPEQEPLNYTSRHRTRSPRPSAP